MSISTEYFINVVNSYCQSPQSATSKPAAEVDGVTTFGHGSGTTSSINAPYRPNGPSSMTTCTQLAPMPHPSAKPQVRLATAQGKW